MPAFFLVAASAIVLRERSILVLRRSAAVDHAPGVWDLPSGRLDAGETVTQALTREIAEETGLTVDIVGPIHTWRTRRGKERHEMIGITHLCRYRDGEVRLSVEHDDHRWVPFAEIDGFPIFHEFREGMRLAARAG